MSDRQGTERKEGGGEITEEVLGEKKDGEKRDGLQNGIATAETIAVERFYENTKLIIFVSLVHTVIWFPLDSNILNI